MCALVVFGDSYLLAIFQGVEDRGREWDVVGSWFAAVLDERVEGVGGGEGCEG